MGSCSPRLYGFQNESTAGAQNEINPSRKSQSNRFCFYPFTSLTMQTITPCLWFDTQALEAANYYLGVFPDSSIKNVSHYGENTPGKPGSVMTVSFTLNGNEFLGLNG